MTPHVRAFIALEIPHGTRQELAEARRPIQDELPRARWVRPEGQHLTLKFLGEVEGPTLGRLVVDLAPRLQGAGAVKVQLAGAGFFPSATRPRVAWIGGAADGAAPIVEVVEEVAERHGFTRERRRWSLHLTQARLDRPWPAGAVRRFLEWGEGLRLEAFVAGEVVLFSSELRPGGAVYTALERMPIG